MYDVRPHPDTGSERGRGGRTRKEAARRVESPVTRPSSQSSRKSCSWTTHRCDVRGTADTDSRRQPIPARTLAVCRKQPSKSSPTSRATKKPRDGGACCCSSGTDRRGFVPRRSQWGAGSGCQASSKCVRSRCCSGIIFSFRSEEYFHWSELREPEGQDPKVPKGHRPFAGHGYSLLAAE